MESENRPCNCNSAFASRGPLLQAHARGKRGRTWADLDKQQHGSVAVMGMAVAARGSLRTFLAFARNAWVLTQHQEIPKFSASLRQSWMSFVQNSAVVVQRYISACPREMSAISQALGARSSAGILQTRQLPPCLHRRPCLRPWSQS